MNTSPVTQILREKLVVILWLHKWVTGGGILVLITISGNGLTDPTKTFFSMMQKKKHFVDARSPVFFLFYFQIVQSFFFFLLINDVRKKKVEKKTQKRKFGKIKKRIH